MIRAFGVRSSASQRRADVELLDLVRHHPVQIRRGVGAVHRNVGPGPRSDLYVVNAIETEVSERVQEQSGAEGGGGRVRPGAAAARAVPDGEWPVLHAGDVPDYPADLAGWDFRVYGEVDDPVTLSWEDWTSSRRSRSRRTSTA